MKTNYNWVINRMDYKKKVGNLVKVVSTIHWTRVAILIDGEETYTAELEGSTVFLELSQDNFTPYSSITEEQACKWLDEKNDVNLLNNKLNAMIENQINLPVIGVNSPFKL
jgi:hypothetical protein